MVDQVERRASGADADNKALLKEGLRGGKRSRRGLEVGQGPIGEQVELWAVCLGEGNRASGKHTRIF